jgi:hypothetical protein
VHSRQVFAQPVLALFSRDPPEVARDSSSRLGKAVKLGGRRVRPTLDNCVELILTGAVDLRALPPMLACSPIGPSRSQSSF